MILSYTLPGAEYNILKGTKIHTIRKDPRNRWKIGNKIHHATGVRSKNYLCFKEDKCRSVQQILIVYKEDVVYEGVTYPQFEISVDRRRLKQFEKTRLYLSDGFAGPIDFIDWFFPKNKKGERKVTMFAGKIIHWTSLKY